MTRSARRGTSTTKKPLEASTWAELKRDWQGHSAGEGKRGKRDRSGNDGKTPVKTEGSSVDEGKISKAKRLLERKRERRREEKRLKRMRMKEKSKTCEFCNEIGHEASECPCRVTDADFGSCVKCGSSKHTARECKGALDGHKGPCPSCNQDGHEEEDCPCQSSDGESGTLEEYCPICHEPGHEVNSCPDNPRSIYPMGGSCKECGSVVHKTSQCPETKSTTVVEEIRVGTLQFGSRESADAYDEDLSGEKNFKKAKKKKAKVVLF